MTNSKYLGIYALLKSDNEPKINLLPIVENAYLWAILSERKDESGMTQKPGTYL